MIAIFTKFDVMMDMCWGQLGNKKFDNGSLETARQNAQKLFEEKYLSQVQEGTKNPPRDYVCLESMIYC